MKVATSTIEVGVRELKNHLSRYLSGVQEGTDVIVTDRGKPVARLVGVDAATDRLGQLIALGVVQPPRRSTRSVPKRVVPVGNVSALVAEQRR